MKIENVILLLFTSHFIISIFCLISTTQIEKKWYEKIYLWVPIFNLIWTLYTLDCTIGLLEIDKSYLESRSRIYQRRIEELIDDNKSPKKIKIGDNIVYPNSDLWKDEVRGKIGTVIEINVDGVVVKITNNDTYWTTGWDIIYGTNIIFISNDVLKPFKFIN